MRGVVPCIRMGKSGILFAGLLARIETPELLGLRQVVSGGQHDSRKILLGEMYRSDASKRAFGSCLCALRRDFRSIRKAQVAAVLFS